MFNYENEIFFELKLQIVFIMCDQKDLFKNFFCCLLIMNGDYGNQLFFNFLVVSYIRVGIKKDGKGNR